MKKHLLVLIAALAAMASAVAQRPQRTWLAGDSHIHTHWSPGYDRAFDPPKPVKQGDAIYPTALNAQKARQYGLSWIVITDHGGPNHSKLNLNEAYAELQESRTLVPDVVQFYGMEFNMPAMDHHTLIIPTYSEESEMLYSIESQFDANEEWPANPLRNNEQAARAALSFMKALPRLPLLLANHPSRSASGIAEYGLTEPRELRINNDFAPELYRGMEGAPGHQAAGLARDGSTKRNPEGTPLGDRGAYGNDNARTMGGFDQMTAIVGGLWDSLLGEGRRFWIVATSDSHVHYSDMTKAGSDFWPGEYQKTYVLSLKTHDDVLEGLRSGRIFAVSGDLISELDFIAADSSSSVLAGGTLKTKPGTGVSVSIRFRDPETNNASNQNPSVRRVDLILGSVRGPVENKTASTNDTTKVIARFTEADWSRSGDLREITTTLPRIDTDAFVRVRGTSTDQLEPAMDERGENPWTDLWFYSNPIFIDVQ